jgi:hypothetical protein
MNAPFTYLMGCTIDLMTMKPSSSCSVGNIAGAVSIVCFLALASVVTLGDVFMDGLASIVTLGDVFMDEDEDTDSKESFISWLWGFWLLCLLGIVVLLMRLRNDGRGFLYRLEMGLLALILAFDAVNYIAASRWVKLFVATAVMLCFANECLKQSPRVTAWFCHTQMFGLFFLVALSSIPIMFDAITANKDLLMEWTIMVIMGILTVSCFVVAFVVPPVIILVEEEPLADPAVLLPVDVLAQAAEDQSKTMSSSSNFEYQKA